MLVDENYNVKVCDFGLTQATNSGGKGQCGSYSTCGTPLWMAPEVLLNQSYDERVDVYSFGIVLWQLVTEQEPYPEIESMADLLDIVVSKNIRPKIPKTCPSKLKRLIEVCWQAAPSTRPSFQQIIPLFKQIIVDYIIRDKCGRALWKCRFMDKEALLEKVPWKSFIEGLNIFFNTKVPSNVKEDPTYRSLHALLVDKKEYVSIEAFGRFLEWFGPMVKLDAVLQSVVTLLKKSWFHGEVSAEEAEKLLSKKRQGTFLVRFSSKDPGSYAISVVSDSNKIKHFRIYHKPGLQYLIGKTECESMDDIISRYHKVLFYIFWLCHLQAMSKSQCPNRI